MVKCKNCIFLKDYWCDQIYDSPDEELERDCPHFHAMTNADRIRAMSDEELAEWHEWCPHIEEECTMKGCVQCIIEWLKQPVEEVEPR